MGKYGKFRKVDHLQICLQKKAVGDIFKKHHDVKSQNPSFNIKSTGNRLNYFSQLVTMKELELLR